MSRRACFAMAAVACSLAVVAIGAALPIWEVQRIYWSGWCGVGTIQRTSLWNAVAQTSRSDDESVSMARPMNYYQGAAVSLVAGGVGLAILWFGARRQHADLIADYVETPTGSVSAVE